MLSQETIENRVAAIEAKIIETSKIRTYSLILSVILLSVKLISGMKGSRRKKK